MLSGNKNFKDSIKDTTSMPGPLLPSLEDKSLSYTKTNKLITALYMVTDTMEKDEPLRLKLRTLGVEILSDINLSKTVFNTVKTEQILSFLNIAFDIRMISEMNYNILLKEFTELKQSIQDYTKQKHSWLEEFMKTPASESLAFSTEKARPSLTFPKGQTRLGVQRGSTLMNALQNVHYKKNDFDVLKNKRREEIITIIKEKKLSGIDGTTIKDIMLAIRNLGEGWGEKTLQRELVSMVKDSVLYKTGEKRWSKYFVK